jgi:hypothetical protein
MGPPAAPTFNMPVPPATAQEELRKQEALRAAIPLIAGRFRSLFP